MARISREAQLRYQETAKQAYAMSPERQAKVFARKERHKREHPEMFAWYYYRKNAKRANRIFSLDRRLFEDLVTDNCYYCLALPSPINGIDRVDNSRGYEVDNVVTACSKCNYTKKAMTKQGFEEWACRVADNVRMTANG